MHTIRLLRDMVKGLCEVNVDKLQFLDGGPMPNCTNKLDNTVCSVQDVGCHCSHFMPVTIFPLLLVIVFGEPQLLFMALSVGVTANSKSYIFFFICL